MIAPGTAVRVRDDWPEEHGPVHIRTPHYVRGRAGRVTQYLGRFPSPEDLAFARPAALLDLYHVVFDGAALWPDAYGEVLVEVYETWLVAA